MADPSFANRIAEGYASEGALVELGRPLLDGELYPDVPVGLPLRMMNRHGLIAGATGTGKTRTLQLLAEQLSAAGVPVFTADMKGDLSGLTAPMGAGGEIEERVRSMNLKWEPSGFPVNFLSLGGVGPGIPLRATVETFGAQLLGKVLRANETQSSSLSLVFHYSRSKNLPLVDLSDLRMVLHFLTGDQGKSELASIGGLSKQTAGVLLRKILELQEQGADAFFGEPEVAVGDLLTIAPDGRGLISCLELPAVQDKPRLFSTFIMWLLTKLFQELPEIGDPEKPRLVFFFDEAHLLFDDASKAFVDQVAQTVRLIRSKGVGVFFVTHYPDDIPDEVLGQLGNRIQHALRAFTPRDARALKATVTTYPKTEDYDLHETLTKLGTGEAIVTVLSETGAPTPVVWTRMRAPQASMGSIGVQDIDRLSKASEIWPRLSNRLERESAAERIQSRLATTWEPKVERRPPRRARRVSEGGESRTRRRGGRRRFEYILLFLIIVALIVVVAIALLSTFPN